MISQFETRLFEVLKFRGLHIVDVERAGLGGGMTDFYLTFFHLFPLYHFVNHVISSRPLVCMDIPQVFLPLILVRNNV